MGYLDTLIRLLFWTVTGEAVSMKAWRAALLLFSGAAFFSAEAFAGTATGTLTVSATVSSSCAVSSGGGTLSFGAYDPVNANANTALTQSGTFQVQCTNGTTATILLGQGSNPSSGSTDALPLRNMTNGNSTLQYQLYTTAGRTVVWDNAIGVSQLATGMAQTITVYGSVLAGQNVPPGNYTDVVVISVNY